MYSHSYIHTVCTRYSHHFHFTLLISVVLHAPEPHVGTAVLVIHHTHTTHHGYGCY